MSDHASVPARGLGSPRNGLPAPGGYVYRGTGRDELTPYPVMLSWYQAVRDAGADPAPRTREGTALLAEVETALARGDRRPA